MPNYNTFFNIDLEAVRKETQPHTTEEIFKEARAIMRAGISTDYDDWGRPVNNTPNKH